MARPVTALAAALAASLLAAAPARALETRSFVVSWFTVATFSEEGDCPKGLNPSIDGIYLGALRNMGYQGAELDRMFKKYVGTTGGEEAAGIIVNRARVDGRPVNAYANPMAAPDPHLNTVEGRYAFGFDLDGRATGLEDPETHERGIDNEYVRAMGCNKSMRAVPPDRPLQGGGYQWETIRSSMPAWLLTVSGDSLSRDGAVTVTVERALEHVTLNARAETQPDATFRVDPDPRWHNVYQARLKDGVITMTTPSEFHMLSDPYYIPEFTIRDVRLRLRLKPDGTLEGILGGYQPWLDIYWSMANGGIALECCVGIDFIGMYHTLRRLADAYPDPGTGQNTAISVAYRIEAVPAFTAPAAPRTARAELR
jgi:hypothetical protein